MPPLTVSKQTHLSEVIALMSNNCQTYSFPHSIASSTTEANTSHEYSLEQSSLMPSCVVIVEDGKPIGILTERDLVRLAATENTIANRTVETVMTCPLITVSQEKANDLFAALRILQQHHIHHLPIVDDDNKLVGILTLESIRQSLQPTDLLRLHHTAEMMTRDVIQATPTTTLQSIAQLMNQHQISCVVITETIEDKTFPLGIVTKGDIIQFQALLLDFTHLTTQSVMSYPVFCASPELSLWQAYQLMFEHRITHLVITHGDGSLAGILTQTAILQVLNPAEMVEMISLLQQQVERLETEKLQLFESHNTKLQEELNRKLVTHQQTELHLREIEKRYTSLVATLPIVIFRADTFGACTYINKHWTELTGISYRETLGQGWIQGIYSDDQDQVVSSWQQMVQMGHPWEQEFRLQLPDGSIKWVYGQAQPEWEDTGKISSYVGSLTNISNRKQSELALRESEQLFRRAIADAPIPIMIHAEDGEVLQISSTWTELTGYTHTDIPTIQAWVELAYNEQNTIAIENIISQQYSLKSRLEEGDYIITTHDSQQRVWNFNSASLGKLPDGRQIAIAMAADITEKQQAKTTLHVRKSRYQALIEVIPDLLICQDAEGNYFDLVMSDETQFIQPDLAYSGINIYDLLPLELAEQWMTYVRQALETGEVQIYDFEINIGGDLRWQEARIVAINQTEVLAIVRDISERKQVEAQLQVTAQRLQQAQRMVKLGYWDLNLQTNNLYWSNEVFRIFEINQNQFDASYEAFLAAIHPDDREMVNQAYNQHVQDGTPYSIIHRLLMPDGRIKYVQEECETIQDDDGKAILSHGTILDITNLKEEEYKRQQAEASLHQIVEGTAAVIEHDFFKELVQHITKALNVRYASVSEAKSDGFAVLAFCADGHLQTVNQYPYEQVPCCMQALQQGQCYHPESLLYLYPGNELFSSLNAESYLGIGLHNSAGKPIGNLSVIHDRPLKNPKWMINLLKIFGARAGAELERYQTACQLQVLANELEQRVNERTAMLAKTIKHLQTEIKRRKALSNLLLKSQTQLQDIFDSANDMIQSVSLIDGSFEFVNRSWLETLGYTAQDLEQLTIFDILHPDCQEHCMTLMKQLKMGQLQSLNKVEISFVAKNGRIIDVEGNINCCVVDGQAVYTRGLFRDISERKKVETEIIKMLEHERELNEMKSRFISNTSHEFRTPLTVISSNTELLKQFGGKLDEVDKQNCLNTILAYVDHMTELIDEVLIISRAESGKIRLKLKPLDIVEFSQQLSQTISLSAPNHHLEFVIKDTRSQSQKHIHSAQIDSKIIQQSLTNLLTNAIKYSPGGSTVTFQLELLPKAIEFSILDQGIGIPEEDQKYLFEPFHRATNVGTIQGTGLGLSIVKYLITIHQGWINLKSAPGEGSCFTITIPIQWQEVDL